MAVWSEREKGEGVIMGGDGWVYSRIRGEWGGSL